MSLLRRLRGTQTPVETPGRSRAARVALSDSIRQAQDVRYQVVRRQLDIARSDPLIRELVDMRPGSDEA